MTALRFYKCPNGHFISLGCCVYEDSFKCEECDEQATTPATWEEAMADIQLEIERFNNE